MVWSSVTTPLLSKKHVTTEVVIFLSSASAITQRGFDRCLRGLARSEITGYIFNSKKEKKKRPIAALFFNAGVNQVDCINVSLLTAFVSRALQKVEEASASH